MNETCNRAVLPILLHALCTSVFTGPEAGSRVWRKPSTLQAELTILPLCHDISSRVTGHLGQCATQPFGCNRYTVGGIDKLIKLVDFIQSWGKMFSSYMEISNNFYSCTGCSRGCSGPTRSQHGTVNRNGLLMLLVILGMLSTVIPTNTIH